MELQDKLNSIMQQMITGAESTMGPHLVEEAKTFYKDNADGYFEWLNYCSTLKGFKPDISDDEFSPSKFEAVQSMLRKSRR